MAHHKRRKPRRNVRCTICTDCRNGNSASKGASVGFARRQHLRHFDWRKDQGRG